MAKTYTVFLLKGKVAENVNNKEEAMEKTIEWLKENNFKNFDFAFIEKESV